MVSLGLSWFSVSYGISRVSMIVAQKWIQSHKKSAKQIREEKNVEEKKKLQIDKCERAYHK